MQSTPAVKAPMVNSSMVLSYVALRRVVGIVAITLPFIVSLPVYLFDHGITAGSISGYYYYGTRDVFVGCLCAISVFMFCNRGYDWRDEVAGVFSAICGIGVAMCPTTPDHCASTLQEHIGVAHYVFASLLFSTLAVFCLWLFKMTDSPDHKTPEKAMRNLIYTICGITIIVSMATILIASKFDFPLIFGSLHWTLVFEATALIAFGIAWLTKGETIFRDRVTAHRETATSNRLFGLAKRSE